MCGAVQAQKRFRERQKTKFTELTSKVEQLEARLATALVEKAKSEDRAAILEKCLELRGNLPVAASSGAAIGEVRAGQHNALQEHTLPACRCPACAEACCGWTAVQRKALLVSACASLPDSGVRHLRLQRAVA